MKKKSMALAVCVAVLGAPILLAFPAGAGVVTLPITQTWQHKDTNMTCIMTGSGVPHALNHATNPPPGCAHCGFYCAPASISMYAQYLGLSGVSIQQDNIYDSGKSTGGEIPGDGILQTHGIGMFDVGPPFGPADEVGAAFAAAIRPPFKWGPAIMGFPAMTAGYVIQCIDDGIPLLWCDHYGWPDNIYPPPDSDTAEYNGHAKIIAGYDDNGTAVFNDDLYYIYDPWPTAVTPAWVPNGSVLDNRDVFYAAFDPVDAEQHSWGEVKALFR